ncbi:MAG: hypothetical protein HQL53_07940 [Magnetococcales bacterium]|nr:hypothetical protein [Magnetococcales bacterium]
MQFLTHCRERIALLEIINKALGPAMKPSRFAFGRKSAALLTLLIAVAAYIPFILQDFAFHNDYAVWTYDNRSGCCYPETVLLVYIGRFLNALLLNVQLMMIGDIADMALARLMALMTMIVVMVLLTKRMIKDAEMPPFVAFFLGSWLILLPTSVAYVLWVTHYGPGPLILLFSIILYSLINRPANNSSLWRMDALHVLGYLFVLFLFFIYPPNAAFFLVIPFAAALFSSQALWEKKRFCFARQLILVGALQVIYATLTKISQSYWFSCLDYFRGLWVFEQYESVFSFSHAEVWQRFVKLFEFIIQLWGLADYTIIGWAVCLIIVIGVIVGFMQWVSASKLSSSRRAIVERILLTLGIFIVASSPAWVPQVSILYYRMVFLPYVLIIIALLWALHRMALLLSGRASFGFMLMSVLVLTVVALSSTMWRVSNITKNAVVVHAYVKAALDDLLDRAPGAEVYLIKPDYGRYVDETPLLADFRYATHMSWDGFYALVMNRRGVPEEQRPTLHLLSPAMSRIIQKQPSACPDCIDVNRALPIVLNRVDSSPADERFVGSDDIIMTAEYEDVEAKHHLIWRKGRFVAINPELKTNIGDGRRLKFEEIKGKIPLASNLADAVNQWHLLSQQQVTKRLYFNFQYQKMHRGYAIYAFKGSLYAFPRGFGPPHEKHQEIGQKHGSVLIAQKLSDLESQIEMRAGVWEALRCSY